MRRHPSVVAVAFAVLAATASAQMAPAPKPGPRPTTDPVAARPVLSSAGAKTVMAAAIATADENGWGASIALVDDGGRLLAFHRTDGAPIGTIEVAQGKAETAIRFKLPTAFLQKMVAQGGPAMLTLGKMVAVTGGYPIVRDGQVVGAIGVSGGMSGEDDIIAKAGLAAIGG